MQSKSKSLFFKCISNAIIGLSEVQFWEYLVEFFEENLLNETQLIASIKTSVTYNGNSK